MQISFVMLIFLLLSNQISSRGQKSRGGGNASDPLKSLRRAILERLPKRKSFGKRPHSEIERVHS